ncbi:MAG: glycosyltransferase family 1 protein [Methylobacter sp.]|nr:glycosyltransferase family 1 protein [Methylobacter sp.]
MNIIFDNSVFALQRAGGISIYWYELLRRTIRDKHSAFFIERPESGSNIFRKSLYIDPLTLIADKSLPLSITRYLPFKVIKGSNAIYHSSYYRVPEQRGSINVTTVHDFTYERFRRGPARIIHSLQKRAAVKAASGIICVSESTKRDLLEFFPEITGTSIEVVYHGVSEHFRPLEAEEKQLRPAGVPHAPFVLFVGARESYKNFHLALESLAVLPDYWLVSVGNGELKPNERALSQKHLPGRHIHFPVVDSERLNCLYNYSHVLLYPSCYEGFGIPLIEAMASGCPVIASNVTAIPEACGNAGLLVNEVRAEAFSEQILRLEKADLRQEYIGKGYIQAKRFSWETCYLKTISFYEKILQENEK